MKIRLEDIVMWGLALAALIWVFNVLAAEPVKVAQFNEAVRIVLTNRPCPMQDKTLLAVAQRIDKQFMRGCYSYNPNTGMVRIQWSGDKADFTEMEGKRFLPDTIPDSAEVPTKGAF